MRKILNWYTNFVKFKILTSFNSTVKLICFEPLGVLKFIRIIGLLVITSNYEGDRKNLFNCHDFTSYSNYSSSNYMSSTGIGYGGRDPVCKIGKK